MRVNIRLLGGFDVTVDDSPIARQQWRRRSAASLVKLLALQPEHRLTRDQVIDALWPDLLLEDAAPRLHVSAHHARAALGSRAGIVLGGGTVALFPEHDVSVDAAGFERAAVGVRTDPQPDEAAEAAALYSGLLLPDDLYEPWTEEPRARLRLLHQELLRTAGRFEDLVDADPLDEAAHLAVIRTHIRKGRRQSALRALERMEEVFRRELGVPPGPAAAELRETAEALPIEVVYAAEADESAGTRPGRATSRLPAPRNKLIGRDGDLDQLVLQIEAHRIVTITGPGGAGKSTLAVEVARRLQDEGEAGRESEVILAELAPVRDEEGVIRAVAEAAGVQGEGAVLRSTLAANLGPREVLLVLDNCEHLLDASAALVDAVLDGGPGARILVTSREPLRVDGEVDHRIGSLGASSAQLFAERAEAAAGPGAASADDSRVVELCARLDGLPLAIELAAAQLRHLSLTELVERLDDRLTLLVGGRPKAGGRHTALATAIDWSYQLLSEESRDLFNRLGVFPASFDLDAVQAVADDLGPAAVTNLLGDLVAKSLVVHDPRTGRYRLLETIRLFAASRLDDAGLRAGITERLRRHVVAQVTVIPRVRTWLSAAAAARSRDDLENVRLAFDASLDRGDVVSAVDLALGLSTLWRNAVSYTEGLRWVAALRESELPPAEGLWTAILAADVGIGSGDPFMMRDAAADAAARAEQFDEPGAAVITEIYTAISRFIEPAEAAERLERARDRAGEIGEPGLERLARGFRLVALRLLGRPDGLDAEARALIDADAGGGYDHYICIFAASLLALVDRDAQRQRELMRMQVADLTRSGLYENWLTMYWESLARIAEGGDYISQLRSVRRRAAAEGRGAEADCVLALSYAAACDDDWEGAAELLGATGGGLLRDTASFIHYTLLREQLVRPRLEASRFEAASTRGRALDVAAILEARGL